MRAYVHRAWVWLGGAVSLAGSVIALVTYFQERRSLVLPLALGLVALGVVVLWLQALCVCSRRQPGSTRAPRIFLYPKAVRRLSLAGVVGLPILVAGCGLGWLIRNVCLHLAGITAPIVVTAAPLLALGSSLVWLRVLGRKPPRTQITILIADFEGPEPEKYSVTKLILGRLLREMKRCGDITVCAAGRPITERQGSEAARTLGREVKASIVLWGWYTATEKKALVTVHVEALREPVLSLGTGEGYQQIVDVAQLQSFSLQTRLARAMTCLVLVVAGLARMMAEDWGGAIDRFTAALSQGAVPKQVIQPYVIYFYRALSYQTAGNPVRAIADYDRAIDLKPDLAAAYNNRGLAYADQGNPDRAIADFDRAIDLKPDLTEGYYNRGNAHAARGELDLAVADFDRAIANYDRAIGLKPDLTEAYYNRGNVHAARGELDLAIADYDRAIALKPDCVEAYVNRGIAHAARGELDLAIADFDKAIGFQPGDAEAYYNRGLAHARRGNVNRAITDFQAVLRLAIDEELRRTAQEHLDELGSPG